MSRKLWWGTHVLWILMLLPVFSGCAGLTTLADTMNARNIQSCVYWSGFAGGPLSGAQVSVKGVTATGGVAFEKCLGEKNAN